MQINVTDPTLVTFDLRFFFFCIGTIKKVLTITGSSRLNFVIGFLSFRDFKTSPAPLKILTLVPARMDRPNELRYQIVTFSHSPSAFRRFTVNINYRIAGRV